ncbi:related to 3-phytase precursor [Rhynchosporium secalis]|uniref:Related to 3-phytase n=1 Tax=Rhynchosporium secalis TaxID=38038 RepID=A0A1E1M752_RHYSE|nr:related to 3-phytase precursor [Rhynchosporium secalis]
MKHATLFQDLIFVCVVLQSFIAGAAATDKLIDLPISARTSVVDSDNSAVYHSSSNPLLLGNDGSATGGFRIWSLDGSSPLREVSAKATGRSKLVTTVYDIGKKDLIITISQPNSVLRVFDVNGFQEIKEAAKSALGDWSALCSWKSPKSGSQYFYLFGKKQVVQYLVRADESLEIFEVQTFNLPVEASSCAVSLYNNRVYFTSDKSKTVYGFKTEESVTAPTITTFFEAADDVTGMAVYAGVKSDYLFVAQKDLVAVYTGRFRLVGTMKLSGGGDIELQGFAMLQAKTATYPAGALTYAIEADAGKAFGVSSLESALKGLKIEVNTAFDPRAACKDRAAITCTECNSSGFCEKKRSGTTCACFAGFAGPKCQSFTCVENCSGHGTCVGANECRCEAGWGGVHCSFLLLEPKLETVGYGGDGDDPAIWISPLSADQSRIITTTKSEQGAGLGVFDLSGNLLQTLPAGEPNNVDMIYNFTLGSDRVVDLAFAACREDNTLCLFEMSSNGTLSNIAGGSQPVVADYDVYGSCSYRSPKTGVQYLFVNSKTAEYLQYALTSAPDGSLNTTLVRQFTAGSGGQVEGCVTDEANGFLLVGEEPVGVWRYDAEPTTSSPAGYRFASVATYPDHKFGDLYADVEGVTLIPGKTASDGFILVSCQGVSGYNVYERAPPHKFVETFTITNSKDGKVDHVTNTDGIAAVGNRLNSMFPNGLVVVHDDANELPGGESSTEASFKFVSLADVLSEKLLEKVDAEWDPRA